MPILVVCPTCHTRFQVSEKFAGKQGPCPKCKAQITVPKLEDEVKVHAPQEFAGGGKDAKGRPVLKPIEREETKVRPAIIGAIVAGTIAVLVGAYFLGQQEGDPHVGILAAGLAAISPALVLGAYTVLRDQELEPYRGMPLLARVAICAAVYAIMWGAFGFLYDRIEDNVLWLFYAAPFLIIGTLTAMYTLDLDAGSAFFHYGFFLVVTILLRMMLGLPILRPSETPFA